MKKHRRRRYKRKNNIIINLFLLIFIVVFILSLTKIIYWYLDNQKSNEVLKDIDNSIKINKNTNKYKIDFNDLKKKNSDTVAFIKVNNTNIEYPIVKSNNNDYYLNHSFDKSINNVGWIFANYINQFDETDKNITIFGHARRDGSMFGTLYKTLSSKWQSNINNLKILFITEKDTYYYQVFSTYKILNEDYYIKNNFKDDKEYREFLNKIKERSNHNYNINLNEEDKILTLSTCALDDKYRIVLHAKRIIN
ncbi:MAG: class B sortase [Bacilli bacterium]|nr:class B sortase [Bacilli bacterium]